MARGKGFTPVFWPGRSAGHSAVSAQVSCCDSAARPASAPLALWRSRWGRTAWAVTFVCDGFVTLRHAEAVSSSNPDTVAALLADFRANQLLVVRLGLVSFILIGSGIAAFGASILAAGLRSRLVSWLLGAGGVLLGLWPLLAWAIGVFEPGPFTSPWWRPTANLTTLWFMSGGIAILTQATRATMSSGRRAGRE